MYLESVVRICHADIGVCIVKLSFVYGSFNDYDESPDLLVPLLHE